MDFELLKDSYLKLRKSVIKYLDGFDEESYHYQPTEKSNSTAWIIPHIVAFEKLMVTDKISGYVFPEFISQDNVDIYKPTVDGFNFSKEDLLTKEEAIKLLEKTQKVSIEFLDKMINQNEEIKNVEKATAFDRFLFNFSHETEHLGQLKYLLGTFKRTR